MLIALVSDIHIHSWSEFSLIEDGVPSRLSHGVRVLVDVREYCNEHDIKHVIIAGDVFHKRNVIYTKPYQMVVEALQAFKRDGIEVYAVSGNHDQADKEGTVSTIDTFAAADLVTQGVPSSTGWQQWPLPDVTVSAFSYCDNRDLLFERVEKAVAGCFGDVPRHIGVFHHGFKGARVGSALEYVVKEDVDVADFGNAFDFIFSGHYHGRQRIGDHAKACYIGSPMQHVRGEGPEDKGFMVYDSKTNTARLVPLVRPRFVKLTQELLASKPRRAKQLISGNFVDFHYETWDAQLTASITKLGAAGVKLVPVKRKTTAKERRLEVDPTLNVKTVLKRYIKYRKDDVKHLDQAELLRIGLDLYNSGEE